MNYKEAGVDIEKGNDFVAYIRGSADVGAFSSSFKLGNKHVLTTCDGVGTKILVAKELDDYSTIGIDLVAMCVNDILASGGKPVSFLDYIACGEISNKLKIVIDGIIKGCESARCKLSGGETAELPDMYGKDDIDLAGFAVGVANREFPELENISAGNLIVGLPSSGIHSNGLSLARKVLDKDYWKELLIPTRIYAKEMASLLKKKYVYGAAHITGGGLSNIQRMLPKGRTYHLYHNWFAPPIFSNIATESGMSIDEMQNVFNMGIGMAVVVNEKKADKIRWPVIGEVV